MNSKTVGRRVDDQRTVTWFSRIAFWEAVSYVVLLGASVLKRLDGPNLVPTLGPIHGVGFVAYVVLALMVRPILEWTWWRTAFIVFLAGVPIVGFSVAKQVAEQGQALSVHDTA